MVPRSSASVATLPWHGLVAIPLTPHPTLCRLRYGVSVCLQLFIEFMQLLSIFRLTRIGVVWRTAAEAVLLAMSIAPISSYGWVSFECLLRESLSPQQYALDSTLATTFIPGATACQRLLPAHARLRSHHNLLWLTVVALRKPPPLTADLLCITARADTRPVAFCLLCCLSQSLWWLWCVVLCWPTTRGVPGGCATPSRISLPWCLRCCWRQSRPSHTGGWPGV